MRYKVAGIRYQVLGVLVLGINFRIEFWNQVLDFRSEASLDLLESPDAYTHGPWNPWEPLIEYEVFLHVGLWGPHVVEGLDNGRSSTGGPIYQSA